MVATSWRVAERTPGRYPTTERPLWMAISSMHCMCVIRSSWITRICLNVHGEMDTVSWCGAVSGT